jgi:hypothetical protein
VQSKAGTGTVHERGLFFPVQVFADIQSKALCSKKAIPSARKDLRTSQQERGKLEDTGGKVEEGMG